MTVVLTVVYSLTSFFGPIFLVSLPSGILLGCCVKIASNSCSQFPASHIWILLSACTIIIRKKVPHKPSDLLNKQSVYLCDFYQRVCFYVCISFQIAYSWLKDAATNTSYTKIDYRLLLTTAVGLHVLWSICLMSFLIHSNDLWTEVTYVLSI